VSESVREKPRLFLTFAEADLGDVRPVAAQLRRHGRVALDYAVPAEPFTAQRSYLIRASLAVRIQRCCGALCLIGAETHTNDWVRWTLRAAREMTLPLIGAVLDETAPDEAVDLLAGLGVEIVPLSTEAVVQKFVPPPTHQEREHQSPLALALRLMRHPLH
jgi:hypothetical protein